MKILLSPAKMLDFSKEIKVPEYTQIHFLKETESLVKKIKSLPKSELKKLFGISENLVDLNYQRYQQWKTPLHYGEESKPALTVFDGEVYKGLDVKTFSSDDFKRAQESVRILSGLYGILKPLDLMYPYRLEMGTKWKISAEHKNLYSYWSDILTTYLKKDLQKDEVIVNLASSEYFKVLNTKQIDNPIITPVFKEYKNGEFKVVMMYAKHARGAMTRYIIQHKINKVQDLKGYNMDQYSFDEKASTENEWVFIR
ncbi:MAG: peroxide stress protein YaaA [Brumimicrobium sp.]|nr:peroxide stress protein YaaA [Brumimicrobium sp.]